jgi:hypothetical protein
VCVGVLALSACDSTLQSTAIPHNLLEYMVESPYPVYWLGATFEGMPVSEANHDPSDAWSISYGTCIEGGEGSCVPPLELVTSPDNSFLPGAGAVTRSTRIRGVPAVLSRGGRTIALATAGVVLDIYATSARVAAAAARTAVAINQPAALGAPLAPALPNTGFGETPLPTQVPSPLRTLP